MRRLLMFLGLVIVASTIGLVVGYFKLDQNPLEDAPNQFKACGRTYVNPAENRVTRQAIETQGLAVRDFVQTWQGKRAVWGVTGTSGCGLGVFLQVGANDFRGYNLSGAP